MAPHASCAFPANRPGASRDLSSLLTRLLRYPRYRRVTADPFTRLNERTIAGRPRGVTTPFRTGTAAVARAPGRPVRRVTGMMSSMPLVGDLRARPGTRRRPATRPDVTA